MTKGELSSGTYKKLLQIDIKPEEEYNKILKIKSMDFKNKEHLNNVPISSKSRWIYSMY